MCQLPLDLRILVQPLTSQLQETTEITALRTASVRRQTLKLRFENGSLAKGRLLGRSSDAPKLLKRLCEAQAGRFSQILSQHDDAWLEEWIPGTPLDRLNPPPPLLFECGQMLGKIHCVDGTPVEPPHEHTNGLVRLVEQLEQLRQRGVLSGTDCQRLWALAQSNYPAEAQMGIIHRDFCAENLVLHQGQPYCIDNVQISVGALDEDLARTRYRWPMSLAAWERFMAGYESHRSSATYRQHALYWNILVLASAAGFRFRAQADDPWCPLEKLRRLIFERPSTAMAPQRTARLAG